MSEAPSPAPSGTKRPSARKKPPAPHHPSSFPLDPRRIWADFVLYARSYLRSPEAVFFSLLFPFILVLMFGAIFSGNTTLSPVTVYVQNQDVTNGTTNATTLAFYHALDATGALVITNVSAGVGNLSLYMAQHSYSNGMVIPPNFGEHLYTGMTCRVNCTPVVVTLYYNPSDQTSSGIVQAAVSAVLNHFNQRNLPPVAVVGPVLGVTGESYTPRTIDYEIPGLIGFAIIINPMFAMVNVTSEYKKEKLFKALSLTPLTKGEWLVSKVVWHWVMSIISAVILFATGVLVYHAHVLVGPLIIPFLIVGPLLFVSMGMLIGTLSKKAETAGIIGNLVTFPMMFLSGAFIPVAVQPSWLQPYARVWPLYYIIDGIQAVSVFSNTAEALFDLALISLMAAITFVAAVVAFRWREE